MYRNALPEPRSLRLMFVLTSMPVGGAETLLVNLVRKLDRNRFEPEICCLKERGPLGETLAAEVPVHAQLLNGKYNLTVLPRLTRLLKRRQIDAVITVGAGDKMFWGRLAAWQAGTPVVLCALHSTGWPDGVGKLNRRLTHLTDGFIAVADAHGRHLIEHEHFPASKVYVIPNGVDVIRFAPGAKNPNLLFSLGMDPSAPVVGTVAALRPEKNHQGLLRAFALLRTKIPRAQLLIVGDGPERARLEALRAELGLSDEVCFAGSRSDVPELLRQMDAFVLTSHNEANPVSILEAMACGKPVVAPNVGSIHEAVSDGATGYLTSPGSDAETAERLNKLLHRPELCESFGAAGRQAVVERWSLESMVHGYENLVESQYERKSGPRRSPCITPLSDHGALSNGPINSAASGLT